MGLKPTQYRCAAESLLRRFRKEGSLPPVHPVVDVCNAISLAYAIPVAVLDVAQIAWPLEVRYASGDEDYLTFGGQTEHPAPGEVIFADQAGQAQPDISLGRTQGWGIGTICCIMVRVRDGGHVGVPEALLTTQEFAALSTTGFCPLGPIASRTVVMIDYADGQAQCSSRQRGSQQTDLAADVGGSFEAMLRQRYQARELALARIAAACKARGGDGIVALKLTVSRFPVGRTAFTLRGIAVRARTGGRSVDPFTTHIPAQALASLLRSGWVPVSLVFGVSLGSRHDDLHRVTHPRGSADTRLELRSYSDLVKDVRRDARTRLGHAVSDLGADGLLIDQVTVQASERECPKVPDDQDHVAEAVITGTAIVRVSRAAGPVDPAPLTIVRVNTPPPRPPQLHLEFR